MNRSPYAKKPIINEDRNRQCSFAEIFDSNITILRADF
jgi:hypothetical protein